MAGICDDDSSGFTPIGGVNKLLAIARFCDHSFDGGRFRADNRDDSPC